jgi:methylated-DNA-[protein]-cysteine S-methyltransferase
VLAAGGKLGGFSAPGGSNSKARMLELEGVSVVNPKAKDSVTEEREQIGFGF